MKLLQLENIDLENLIIFTFLIFIIMALLLIYIFDSARNKILQIELNN